MKNENNQGDNLYSTRFIKNNDSSSQNFVFDLPETWWSRTYEYKWAKSFVEPNDAALDAACGLVHPLKYYLLQNCRKTYACDIDSRLQSKSEVLKAVRLVYGDTVAEEFPEKFFADIQYDICSLTAMPYDDDMFDKVFCISVLEHLNDAFNKYTFLNKAGYLRSLLRHDIEDSLREFHRVTKKGGKVILTFDYPRINLDYVQRLGSEIGVEFASNTEFHLPDDALYSEKHKLNCFRTILHKK